MNCSTCLRSHVVTLTHRVRIGKRIVEWTECVSCHLKAEAQ